MNLIPGTVVRLFICLFLHSNRFKGIKINKQDRNRKSHEMKLRSLKILHLDFINIFRHIPPIFF